MGEGERERGERGEEGKRDVGAWEEEAGRGWVELVGS